MTHAELVARAARWASGRSTFFVTELKTFASDIPDVWGWGYQYTSIMVECKASRADFLRDAKKPHRRRPELALGGYRYYMCQPGIIRTEELPEKWGLLYCHPRKIEEVQRAWEQEMSREGERLFMASIIRRIMQQTGCEKHLLRK